jgi:hypothetical protein
MGNKKYDPVFYFVSGILLALIFFSHPASVIMLFFLCGMLLFTNGINKSDAKAIVFITVFISMMLGLKFFVFTQKQGYDSNLYAELKNAPEVISGLFLTYPVRFLATRFFGLYLFAALLFMLSIAVLFKRRRGLASFAVAYLLLSLLVTLIIYNKGDGDALMERSFLPFVFMSAIAASFSMELVQRGLQFVFLLLVLAGTVITFTKFVRTGSEYRTRLELLSKLVDYARASNQPKLIAEWKLLDERLRLNHWATSVDVLLLSSLDDQKQVSIYPCNSMAEIDTSNKDPELFLAYPWWVYWSSKDFDPKFFKLDKVPYQILNKSFKP